MPAVAFLGELLEKMRSVGDAPDVIRQLDAKLQSDDCSLDE
jgi:hypothetical protein